MFKERRDLHYLIMFYQKDSNMHDIISYPRQYIRGLSASIPPCRHTHTWKFTLIPDYSHFIFSFHDLKALKTKIKIHIFSLSSYQYV